MQPIIHLEERGRHGGRDEGSTDGLVDLLAECMLAGLWLSACLWCGCAVWGQVEDDGRSDSMLLVISSAVVGDRCNGRGWFDRPKAGGGPPPCSIVFLCCCKGLCVVL